MPTAINDNGATLRIDTDGRSRFIQKSQILEIAVIKTSVIKIDVRMGALYNIYIPHAQVSSPLLATPEELRDALIAMLPVTSGGSGTPGGATEVRQIQQNDLLSSLKADVEQVKTTLTRMEDKTFNEALLTDDSGAGIIYKGFAAIASDPESPVWAIQRITRSGEINSVQWANGNRLFINRWTQRESLSYT